MIRSTKESKICCSLVFSENKNFLIDLLTDISENKGYDEVPVVLFDGSVVTVFTSELEIDSKYNFIRLRLIAADNIHALLSENCIRSCYQLPTDDSLPSVCSFIVSHHDNCKNGDVLGKTKQHTHSLATKWSPESRIVLGVPSFSTLESGSEAEKKDFAKFCVENDLEIVEMVAPAEEANTFDDERETEEYGCKRLLSAISVAAAFIRNPEVPSGPRFQRLHSSSSSEDNSEPKTESEQPITDLPTSSDQAEQFEELFSQLVSMKERCQAIPSGTDRHLYAEKVVQAFWKAIGGVDDELDSSSVSSLSSPDSGSDEENLIENGMPE